jgi:hypothetical protein
VDKAKSGKILFKQKHLRLWKSLANGFNQQMLQIASGEKKYHTF